MGSENKNRLATSDFDIEKIIETFTLAFREDPTWSPFLYPAGNTEIARKYWGLFVRSASRYPWSFTNDLGSVAAVWYPPGANELSAEEEAVFPAFVTDLLGEEEASRLLSLTDRFDKATPDGDFFYLSMLAVNPAFSGSGLAMKLLAENLREFDALGTPTYLESSNPANNVKYERMGYKKHGSFDSGSGHEVTTYWRDPITVEK